MKNFLALLVAVLTPLGSATNAWAQRAQEIHALCPDSASEAAIVTGTVADEVTGRPIPAVTVKTSARQFCAQFSDSLGRFRLRVPPGTQRIVPVREQASSVLKGPSSRWRPRTLRTSL